MQDEEAAVVAEDQPDEAEALSKLQKLLDTERMLKQQAVNKLAEIMARKDFKPPTKKVINTLILIMHRHAELKYDAIKQFYGNVSLMALYKYLDQ